jgi:hypothetical protein
VTATTPSAGGSLIHSFCGRGRHPFSGGDPKLMAATVFSLSDAVISLRLLSRETQKIWRAHIPAVQKSELENLREGQRVSFEVKKDPKTGKAAAVDLAAAA